MILGLLLLSSPAWALDFSVRGHDFNLSVTDTLMYRYNGNNGDSEVMNDDFHQLFNTLDVSLSHGDFRLGGRFDLHLFADTYFSRVCESKPTEQSCNWHDRRYVNTTFIADRYHLPQRLYLVVARPEFDLTLGDFYVSLGKGLALNVVKVDELGQDTTIRGGKFILHHRDLELTFMGGEFNPLDVDEATGWKAPWRREPIVGGRAEYRFFDTVIAGVHGVYLITDDPNSQGTPIARTDSNTVFGAGLEAPNLRDGLLSFAGEFDLQRTVYLGQVLRGPGEEDHDLRGVAAYGSGALHLKNLTLLAEFKYYDDFRLKAASVAGEPYELLYHQPPTLERVRAEIKDNTSISGARLRADYNFGARGPVELMVFANYGFFKDWYTDQDHQIHDPYAGFELQWQEGEGHMSLVAGVRRELDVKADALYRQDVHCEMDLEQRLSSRLSMKLSGMFLQRERANDLRQTVDSWQEAEAMLSAKWSPRLAAGVMYERQGDPSYLVGRAKLDPLLGPANYLSGTLQYFINSGTHVSLRAGQSRPGLKCINGLCRNYPGFSGVQLTMVGRF